MQAAKPSASKNSRLFIPNISNDFAITKHKIYRAVTRTNRVVTITMMHNAMCAHVSLENCYQCVNVFHLCFLAVHVMYYTRFRTACKVFRKLLQTVTMYTFVFKLNRKQKYYRPGRLVDLLIHFWLWTHPHAAYTGFFTTTTVPYHTRQRLTLNCHNCPQPPQPTPTHPIIPNYPHPPKNST